MAISQAKLRSVAQSYSPELHKFFSESYYGFVQKKPAFLCHSHEDVELVQGLLVILARHGIKLYVDWRDHSMPKTPNRETARKIQERIRNSDLFFFLATDNSTTSRWCPWEIGYADSKTKIYIVPTYDQFNTYGNEYLQLYPHIDIGTLQNGQPVYTVFQQGELTGYRLSEHSLGVG